MFIGYQVDRVADDLPADLAVRTVPAARYLVLTSERGPVVPAVQPPGSTSGRRARTSWAQNAAFVADFEVFGEESKDFDDGEVDIYVSIR